MKRVAYLTMFIVSMCFVLPSCDKEDEPETQKDRVENQINQNKSLSNYNITFVKERTKNKKIFFVNNIYYPEFRKGYQLNESKFNSLISEREATTINVVDLIDNYYMIQTQRPTHTIYEGDIDNVFYTNSFETFTIEQWQCIDSTPTLNLGDYQFYDYTYQFEHKETISKENNVFFIKDYN